MLFLDDRFTAIPISETAGLSSLTLSSRESPLAILTRQPRRFHQFRAYTSTSATPVVLFTPRTIAVYLPGARVRTIADSASFVGGMVVASISLFCVVFQLSLLATIAPLALCSSSTGSARAPCTPAPVRLGPIARTSTFAVLVLAPPP